jgi:uncharacterized membrane protein
MTNPEEAQFYTARVMSITEEGREELAGFSDAYQVALLKIGAGPEAGQIVTVRYNVTEALMASQKLTEGDTLVVTREALITGGADYQVLDHYRTPGVLVIALVFILLAGFLGRLQGLRSLLGLGLSIAALIWGIIPLILAGHNPIIVSLIGTSLIAMVSMIFAHGLNKRSLTALVATLATLALAFGLSAVAVSLAALTGASSDEAIMLQISVLPFINLSDVLLAGMVIGALGVLDDVTTAQVATVEEISDAGGHRFTLGELYARGLSVGREHIASLVNTLALAYAGAAFPTLLLLGVPGGPPLWVILNGEFIMAEVVRALVGGAALMLAVPIATFLAAWVTTRKA